MYLHVKTKHSPHIAQWVDGEIFGGLFVDGKPHGYGVKSWPDGERYVGTCQGQVYTCRVGVVQEALALATDNAIVHLYTALGWHTFALMC
jgi:hypothetical protein